MLRCYAGYCLAHSDCSGVTLANVWHTAGAQVLRWLMFGAQSYRDDMAGDMAGGMAGDMASDMEPTAPRHEGIVCGSGLWHRRHGSKQHK